MDDVAPVVSTNEPDGAGIHDVELWFGWNEPTEHCISDIEPIPLT
ncbi:hypothetical protein DYY66_2425 [Candidatus Nitrosotalea sp. FS]|nr:hypothetical protein [Candidatus Nitrosotalea sp. FS]